MEQFNGKFVHKVCKINLPTQPVEVGVMVLETNFELKKVSKILVSFADGVSYVITTDITIDKLLSLDYQKSFCEYREYADQLALRGDI